MPRSSSTKSISCWQRTSLAWPQPLSLSLLCRPCPAVLTRHGVVGSTPHWCWCWPRRNSSSRNESHPMTLDASRRAFLQRASVLSLAGIATPWAINLAAMGEAAAATATDYKALVCIFLYGGNDYG